MGPVQFSCPRGVAENSFTEPGFWDHFVDFSQAKQQNGDFTKFSSVRTGIGPDPVSSEIFVAGSRRNPLKKMQISVCPTRFVPLRCAKFRFSSAPRCGSGPKCRLDGPPPCTPPAPKDRRFFKAIIAFGGFPLFLPLAITAFRGPEGYFSLAIIAFGAFEFIVPKYEYRLGKWIRGV